MRKSLSLALVIAMMLSMFIFVLPASAAPVTVGTDEGEYIDAPYFASAPTIDGFVTEAEWGEASVIVDAATAASKDDKEPYSRFIYWRNGAYEDYSTWSYTLWLRWDENYFYIAVKNTDPDKYSLKNGMNNAWDGDSIQARVDWVGGNTVYDGQKPWSSANVPDFIFGYTEIAGGFTECWENSTNKGMTSFSNNPLGVAKAVVAPAFSNYSSDTQKGITTYELAIPWAYIISPEYREQFSTLTKTENDGRSNPQGAIGKELGMSLVVLDDGNTSKAGWDAFLAWGSGICGDHQLPGHGAHICTGSNYITLVETSVTPQAGYQTYDPQSLLDATFSTEHIDPPQTYYDYLTGDFDKTQKLSYDQLSVLTYDSQGDLSTWGASEYKGTITDIGGEHGNVLDYTDPSLAVNYVDTRDGDIEFKVPPSYTFEFDIRYTGNVIGNGDGTEKYEPAIYNWFGGSNLISFRCGYFFNDGAFEIRDNETADSNNPDILARVPYELKKDVWYKWRFQFDNESCSMRFWIDDTTTEADNADNEWGQMIFNERWRYFYYGGEDVAENGTLLIFRQMNTQLQYDNVKVYNFASNTAIEIPDENGGNTNGGGTQTTIKTETGKVDIEGAYKKDGKWFVPVAMKDAYKNATKLSFNITLDPTKADFDSLSGLDAADYTVEKTADGKYTITITNLDAIKAVAVGENCFEVVLTVIDDSAAIGDIISEFTDSYTYVLVSTGDATVYIVIAAVVAVLGCAAVVVVRKRKMIEE